MVPPLRILSLDDGGIRGYSILIILQELMHRTFVEIEGRAPRRREIPKPCDHFDLIVGTGAGGLIAILLGRLRLDIETCKDIYVRMTRRIFETDKTIAAIPYRSTLFKASKLEDAVKDFVRKHTVLESEGNDQGVASRRRLGGGTPMRSSMTLENIGAVTAIYKGAHSNDQSVLLRSYEPRKGIAPEPKCTIWEAVRATTATEPTFKPIKIGQSLFLDEGTRSFNPALIALDEAVIKEWPGRAIGVLISIGTGKRPGSTDSQQQLWWEGIIPMGRSDFINARKKLIAKIEGCEETHKLMMYKFLDDRGVDLKNYFRLNVEVGVGEFGMNEWSRLAEISTNTRRYLANDHTQLQVISSVMKLARVHMESQGRNLATHGALDNMRHLLGPTAPNQLMSPVVIAELAATKPRPGSPLAIAELAATKSRPGSPSASAVLYHPLDTSKQEIRLFRLLPFQGKGEYIRGTLKHFAIDDCPPFQCLSYTWGRPDQGQMILINDTPLSIRENLYNFLNTCWQLGPEKYSQLFPQFQSRTSTSNEAWLWIDQICIDQSTMSERNHQVQLMSSIFQRATEVVAWLGDSNICEAAIKDVKRLPVADTREARSNVRDGIITANLWRRIWVHQEILLANSVTVMGGHKTVSWSTLLEMRSFLEQDERYTTMYTGEFRGLVDLRKTDSAVRELTLLDVLENFSRGECSDDKDRVYGLQGLVRADERIQIDYDLPPEAIVNIVFARLTGCERDLLRNAGRIADVALRLVWLLIDPVQQSSIRSLLIRNINSWRNGIKARLEGNVHDNIAIV